MTKRPNGYGLAERARSDEAIPPTTPEQVRNAALNLASVAPDPDALRDVLDKLGLREALNA